MPRPRPQYLQKQITRHGAVTWYVRVGRGSKIRIRGDYGSTDFWAAYQAAVLGKDVPVKATASTASLAWLFDRYREASAWKDLSLATRRQRENIMKKVLETAGNEPYSSISEATVASGRDRRSDTPAAGRHFVDTMRGLFK